MMLLLACVEPDACADGSATQADGTCSPEAVVPAQRVPSVEELLDALPACDVATGDGRIDLDAVCADPICGGMTYAEMNDALGEGGACESIEDPFTPGEVYSACSWSAGFTASFDDEDRDGAPDAESIIFGFDVTLPYEGTSLEGLGVGVALSCFVDALGVPDTLSTEGNAVSRLLWLDPSLYVFAESGALHL